MPTPQIFRDTGGMLITSLYTVYRNFFRTTLPYMLPHKFVNNEKPLNIYDYIVVGAGCAGSVLAARLSETGSKVLLLEDGPDSYAEQAIPLLALMTLGRVVDTNYRAKPQNNAMLGYIDNSARMFGTKAMGGGCSVNFMTYNRGSRFDYDEWANLGNPGWDFNSVLPYFKKTEDFHDFDKTDSGSYHGRDGPIGVRMRSSPSLLAAGRELGYKVVDPMGKDQIGFSASFNTIKDGVRQNPSEKYLRPIKERTNLDIHPNSRVSRILFNKRKRASAVEFYKNYEKHVVRASKEIIISAGALGTPRLLMLSGIGPGRQLRRLGIPVVSDLPGVGENLQDHPLVYTHWGVKPGYTFGPADILNPEALRQYAFNGSGIFGETNGDEGHARFNVGGDNPDWADVWVSMMSLPPLGVRYSVLMVGFRKEFQPELIGNLGDKDGLVLGTYLARPKSKGKLTLNVTDPYDLPVIDMNMFHHPDDIKILAKGIRKTLSIGNTRAMREGLGLKWVQDPIKPCKHHGFDTDDYWRCFGRYVAVPGYHMSGTAKMAPSSDPMGVVSPRLRVRGVKGLRVADASVMPNVPSGDIIAPVYMVAEKAADLIKEDWGFPIDPLPL